MTPYSISSDQHCHDWSQFSKIGPDGVNSRLRLILDEFGRQALALQKAGGKRMFLAGDLLHVRGKVSPEVLNPTMDVFREICSRGIEVYAIAGNHDLAGAHSNKLGNAMQALDEIKGFTAVTEPTLFDDVMMIPWIEDLDELRQVAVDHANADRDLIMHAPLNGVITGIPNLGLDPSDVSKWGYNRTFVGHYHHAKEFVGGKVRSIGSSSQQTWSDPGTLAGFLMVYDDRVEHHEALTPKFVNVDDPSEITVDRIRGNYVRLRLKDAEDDVIRDAKEALDKCGARNWVDHCSRTRQVMRIGSAAAGNVTLEVSISNFVQNHQQTGKLDKDRITAGALDVLTEARTVGDE